MWYYIKTDSESLPCSQEQAAESSAACCTGGEPLPPLKSKTTHAAFCCNGKLMESYLDSLCGTMYAPSTEPSGAERSMSSAADSPARISPAPGKVKALRDLEAAYGERWHASFAKWDLDTSSWKTHQCLLLGGLESFSETWPKWGMMRGGECSERVIPAHPTSGTGSGYSLPTPTTAPEAPNKNANTNGPKNLLEVAKSGWKPGMMWPTPTKRDYKGTNAPEGLTRKDGKSRMDQLPNAVAHGGTKTRQTWATPCSQMGSPTRPSKLNAPNQDGRLECQIAYRESATTNKGQLNPPWVEWLMGWPIGWTDLKPLAMDKFQQWLRSHGKH